MSVKKARNTKAVTISIITAFVLVLSAAVLFKTDFFKSGSSSRGLSGLVLVRGTVSLEQLKLSQKEIASINRAVAAHRGTFTKVNLHLDAKGGADNITDKTEMTWSMALETPGDCEVKSWSRKVKRSDLVGQMVSYMHKAAREYEEFTRFPDVNQNFQTLYI
ncbi:hypothetical protein [Pseudodesulfovibrio sediminis]|uniref:Uncharacterized protein n=1 Tax=Pseudodesulfovibrio sediminis TaxID=2810563 RepID=A0ABN6ESN5_9BACT|nr:hypothetical protein [Pseudodesulfovibrio sediminis]BCS88470.1 hypothetical protein PSDVSF_17120 [Pseudodesulfovibrio sediminis]